MKIRQINIHTIDYIKTMSEYVEVLTDYKFVADSITGYNNGTGQTIISAPITKIVFICVASCLCCEDFEVHTLTKVDYRIRAKLGTLDHIAPVHISGPDRDDAVNIKL